MIHALETTGGPTAPLWKRCSFYDDATDRVYVPAAILGAEDAVAMMVMFDGVGLIREHGHLYVPADWMAAENPGTVEVCRVISERTRACVARGKGA